MLLLRSLAVWLALMGAEVLHGIARTAFLAPRVGDFRARQIAVFTGSVLIFAITLAFVRWLRPARASQALGIGVLWLGLTLSFELFLGRVVLGLPWERLASDYNLLQGGLLPLGLLVLTLSPLLAGKLRHVL
jgi:hypothetical protein